MSPGERHAVKSMDFRLERRHSLLQLAEFRDQLLPFGSGDLEPVVLGRGLPDGDLQPEELQVAVREAAAEYDRLEVAAAEREQLVAELGELKQRVTALETEVHRLHGVPFARTHTSSADGSTFQVDSK